MDKRLWTSLVTLMSVALMGCVGDTGRLVVASVQPAPTATASSTDLFNLRSVPFQSLYFLDGRPDEWREDTKDEFAVLRTASEWQAFVARHPYLFDRLDPPPAIDFSQKQLVVVLLAPQAVGNARVEIAAIEERPDGLRVHPILWEPEVQWEGGFRPFHIVEMARSDRPLSFAPPSHAWMHTRSCRQWPDMAPGWGNQFEVACTPVDGDKVHARLSGPRDVAVNPQGEVYIADGDIRHVAQDGRVTTLAHLPGDHAAAGITGMAFDQAGNLFVADHRGHAIRRLPPGGELELVAGGSHGTRDGRGPEAQFLYPQSLAADHLGNLYLTVENTIRKVSTAGDVTTFVPEGALRQPEGIATDREGNVYVADGERLLRFSPAGHSTVITQAPNSPRTDHRNPSRYLSVTDLAVDEAGTIYVADATGDRIWVVGRDGMMRVLAGTTRGYADGAGSESKFNSPIGVAVGRDGMVYVADWGNHRVRRITPDGMVSTLAGNLLP